MAIYICSKPLQMMVALILAKPEEDSLYLVDWFSDAGRIAASPVLNRRFKEVKLFHSRAAAMIEAARKRADQVFIDSDIGFKTYLCMMFLKVFGCGLIGVYEEGVGTYRKDLIIGWRKFIFRMLRGSSYFGESFLVGKIFVFDLHRYQELFPSSSSKAVELPVSLQHWCEKNCMLLADIFLSDLEFNTPESSLVRIYLTDWSVDFNLIECLAQKGELYVKPHPHIKEIDLIDYKKSNPNVKWVPASIPAELMFVLFLNSNNTVQIYHYGSSAVSYFSSDSIDNVLLVRERLVVK